MNASGFRYCVIGAGAIGCALAGRLAASGRDVTLVARGKRLALLRGDGVHVEEGGRTTHAYPVIAHAEELGQQDILVIAVKAQSVPALLRSMLHLIGPNTLLLPMVNGIPWWYFLGQGGTDDGASIEKVDPGGVIRDSIPSAHIVGSVVYTTSTLHAGNQATVATRQNIVIGSIGSAHDARLEPLAQDLTTAGIDTRLSVSIRNDLWTKIALNLATNPLSVVSGATLERMFLDPLLLPTALAILRECQAVAESHGSHLTLTIEEMLVRGRQAGPFLTSMLRDYRDGRALELSAIFYAVAELADRVGIPVPVSAAIGTLAHFQANIRLQERSSA